MASYQHLVYQVLHDAAGPLTIDEILERVSKIQPVVSANPRNSIRTAIGNRRELAHLGNGRFGLVSRSISGSSLRIPLGDQLMYREALLAPAEVTACVAAVAHQLSPRGDVVSIDLIGGPRITVRTLVGDYDWWAPLRVEEPATFAAWLADQRRAGADALVLRCRDGVTGDISLEGARLADVDETALAARNETVLETARAILAKTPAYVSTFLLQLLMRGAYRGEPQPDVLQEVLDEHDGRFIIDRGQMTFRRDLTPALRRLLAGRLQSMREEDASILRMVLGSPDDLEIADDETDEFEETEETEDEEEAVGEEQPARNTYRLRVTLLGRPVVSRDIEMLDNQTLSDLHVAIQKAFNWDFDHLHAFFLSGKAWDTLMEIAAAPSFFGGDSAPPYDDEVTLADLEFSPGRQFLYIFDFGDNLRHTIKVLAVRPISAADDLQEEYPRVVGSHGKAPPQYPMLEGEEEEEEEDQSG